MNLWEIRRQKCGENKERRIILENLSKKVSIKRIRVPEKRNREILLKRGNYQGNNARKNSSTGGYNFID